MTLDVAGNLISARQRIAEGDLAAATSLLRDVIERNESVEALHLLGAIGFEQGHYGPAADYWRRAVGIDPRNGELRHLLGTCLLRDGQSTAAIEAFRAALELDPDLLESQLGLAQALEALGDAPGASAAARACLNADPTFPEAHVRLGIILARSGEFAEACTHFRAAIEHADTSDDPNAVRAAACTNYGTAMFQTNRDPDAIAEFDKAIALVPGHADARWNRALAILRGGDYAAGFREYESRWQTEQFRPRVRHFAQPAWDGRALNGRTLLLCGEQGYGDMIQFIRFARDLADSKGGSIIVLARPALRALVATAPGVVAAVGEGEKLPAFDVWANLMSLPLLLGIQSRADVPAIVPYFATDQAAVEAWQAMLGPRRAARRIGLVWSGNRKYPDDLRRSIPLRELARLADIADIELISLQAGPRASELATSGLPIADYSHRFTDFAETAALIACLDLVISVDTAVAHLAGALAKPTWTLLPWCPDWRWGHTAETTPWYPTMRLFRQTTRAVWDDVIARVAKELGQLHA